MVCTTSPALSSLSTRGQPLMEQDTWVALSCLQDTSYPLGSTSACDTGIVTPTARPSAVHAVASTASMRFRVIALSFDLTNGCVGCAQSAGSSVQWLQRPPARPSARNTNGAMWAA